MSRVTLLYLKVSIYLIFIDAALFKTAFEDGQKTNASLAKPADEMKKDEVEEKKPEQVSHTETAAKDNEKAEKEEEVKKEEEEEAKTG